MSTFPSKIYLALVKSPILLWNVEELKDAIRNITIQKRNGHGIKRVESAVGIEERLRLWL
jgi:hypothetical protein